MIAVRSVSRDWINPCPSRAYWDSLDETDLRRIWLTTAAVPGCLPGRGMFLASRRLFMSYENPTARTVCDQISENEVNCSSVIIIEDSAATLYI